MRSVVFLLLPLLAGCVQEAAPALPSPEPAVIIEGIVLDGIYRPVVGANVSVAGVTWAHTDADGAYRLQGNISNGDLLVVTADGHTGASQAIAQAAPGAALRIDITMARTGTATFTDTQVFEGLIPCGIIAQYGHDHGGGGPEDDEHYDCPALAQDHSRFRYVPETDPDDLLIEMFWTPNNEYATHASVVLRDDDGELIAFAEGTSPLRLEIAAVLVEEHLSGGATGFIEVLPGVPEHSIGDAYIGAHIDQRFEVYATTFHGHSMPAHWTIG